MLWFSLAGHLWVILSQRTLKLNIYRIVDYFVGNSITTDYLFVTVRVLPFEKLSCPMVFLKSAGYTWAVVVRVRKLRSWWKYNFTGESGLQLARLRGASFAYHGGWVGDVWRVINYYRLNQWAHWARAQGPRIVFLFQGLPTGCGEIIF